MKLYNEIKGINLEWQSGGSSSVKASLAREAVGANPTGRGKKGTKRHILTGGSGVPLSTVITGANVHDVKELETLLDSIVIARPDFNYKTGSTENLCLDKGYFGEPALEVIVLRGYIPHVVPRGVEKVETSEGKKSPPLGC